MVLSALNILGYFALPVAIQEGFELRRRGRVIESGVLWNTLWACMGSSQAINVR